MLKGEIEEKIRNFDYNQLSDEDVKLTKQVMKYVRNVTKSTTYQKDLINANMVLFDQFLTTLKHTVLLSQSYNEAFNIRNYICSRICGELEQVENCFYKDVYENKRREVKDRPKDGID